MFHRLIVCVGLLFGWAAWAESAELLTDDSIVSLLDAGLFYETGDQTLSQSVRVAPAEPAAFIKQLKPATAIDRVNGGGYWFYKKFINQSQLNNWVLDPSNSIIDSVVVYVYQNGEVQQYTSGYLHDFKHGLSYAVDFMVEPGQAFEVLVYMQSRYYTYEPRLELKPYSEFYRQFAIKNFIVFACFGAILILACYNLFLGVWIRDRSNLYYSGYLLLSIVSWLAAFNALADWFSWKSYWFLITPFFLTVACNTLYVIHFLNLAASNPRLVKYFYGFVGFALLMAAAMPLFSMGEYMLLYGATSSVWLLGALIIGTKRLMEGYKPARFFVLAFAVLAIGVVASSLPMFVSGTQYSNQYLITLIAQTLDMLLLALALADRINLLRSDKEAALSKMVETESWAMAKEKEANVKLQQALTISEEENQRKSDFLRMVSHELRTPLYSIISSVEQWDEIDNDRGRKDLLEYMSYGAARLRMQVDNLVLLAETDNDDLEPTERPFEIRPLLSSLCDNTKGLLNPGVAFDYHCSESVPVSCVSDAYLFEHMLRTVLENACKYTEHGRITLSVQWDEEDSSLVVELTDTGCGMTQDQQRIMFNDFVQVSRGLERSSEGLGIGLTVCYRLSTVLGSDLNIQSEVGVGTIVAITLPVEVVSQVAVPANTGGIEKARVLIVEDNVVNAQILQSLLSLMGAEASIVESGQEALKVIDEAHFDIILMDIQMPVMDGITATRWIRRRNHFMPIVAVTANSDSSVRTRCVEVGMNDFLVKPIRRADLQRVMERQLFTSKPFRS
ncbi:response regulator [Dasania sp. GY-MA-18]|uniref:histidine kinase n=1 Tax=Dasania phycosphaerae TaxID=2950436 RepID=A0A9J6RQS9_9GAMM|nr:MULTISPECIES: 7TM diverse intracellular signaling domain-containing protein [Dasania]MCR8924183.1 response regulator [Dasania sp. GY-MA-18]MCZ0866836.1 response regulator [Dasania phycosphaerae]MCZ0870341.1 response regulator [Dasania phycosphaerae]